MNHTEQSESRFLALVNNEEQYCLWPGHIPCPDGWRTVKDGDKATCLSYIEEVWTDLRPKSLRERMSQSAIQG